ncbi:MAG: hypothetical protein IJ143_09790 [Neisseriaceae bacterium]|nr:hypothetical protein [Neisseriaceae bacterium]
MSANQGVSLEDFMREKTAKPRSVLANFKEDIQKLLAAGYQTTIIHEYLTRNGVKVSKPTLYQFIQRHGLKNNADSVKTSKVSVERIEKKRLPEKPQQIISVPKTFTNEVQQNENEKEFKMKKMSDEEAKQWLNG